MAADSSAGERALLRRLAAEFIGTGVLVFFGAGVATLMFGFRVFGLRGAAGLAAGEIAVALAFGLVLMSLAYVLGPISGCHVNPAVTLGAFLTRRISPLEAAGYVVAQVVGGYLGALLLYGLFRSSPLYSKPRDGLGANGYGSLSILHVSTGGAFLAEVILTAFFVFVVLAETRKTGNATSAGLVIGLSLTTVHLIGIPIDGTSVNPARSLGPALVVRGLALSQVWLFIVAPLVGAVVAAVVHWLFYPESSTLLGEPAAAAGSAPAASAVEEDRPAAAGAAAAEPRDELRSGYPGGGAASRAAEPEDELRSGYPADRPDSDV
jgi:aquaporin Z